MGGVVDASQGPPVSLDQFGRVELGVDHHRVDGGVAQQRLDHMGWGVVVEVFGGEHPSAVVGFEPQWGAVCMSGIGRHRHPGQTRTNGGHSDGGGVAPRLQQIGGSGSRLFLVVVPMVDGRHRGGAVEAFDMADDLGEDPSQPVADGDDPGPIEPGRFDVQQVVEATVTLAAFENVQSGQLTGLLDAKPAQHQQFEQCPIWT